MAGDVKLTVQLQAQDRATKIIRQTHKANEDLIRSMIKAGTAQTRLGAKVALAIQGQGKYRAALIRSADAMSKASSKVASMRAAMTALAGAVAVRAFSDFAVAGEKAANVALRFAQAVPQATIALKAAKEATAGLVEETDLQIVFNRFARLGVSVKDTTRLLELSTKAAIDQGRSVLDVAKVIESSLKGRTTGLVEIGVNLDKITGLTESYAAATGVAVSELDEMDRRLKVALPAALQALGGQFDAVNLKEFNLTMQQTRATFGDFVSDVQVFVAEGWADVFAAAVSAFDGDTIEESAAQFVELREEVDRLDQVVSRYRKGTGAWAEAQLELSRATAAAEEPLGRFVKQAEALPAAARIEFWQSFTRTMGGVSAATRDQVEQVLRLKDAYRELRSAAAETAQAALNTLPALAQQIGADLAGIGGRLSGAIQKGLAAQTRKPKARGRGNAQAIARQRLADLDRVASLQRQIALMSTQDELRAAELKHEQALIEARNRVASIRDASARAAAIEAERTKANLTLNQELDRILRERGRAAAEAQAQIQSARFALQIAQATTTVRQIELELEQRIAEIKASSLDAQAKALMIDEARLTATERRAQIEQSSRDDLIAAVGDGFSGAFAEGAAMLAQMDQNLRDLGRPEQFQNIQAGFQALSAGVGPAIQAFSDLGKTSGSAGEMVAGGVAAGLGAMGPAVAGFVGGVKEQAAIMGAFEAAMAVAMAFVDVPAAISHGIASAMFFAMAGVAAAQPTTPAPSAPTSAAPGRSAGGGGSRDAGTVVVNIGEGMVFGRPSEIGRAVAERMASMSGTGMEATAF